MAWATTILKKTFWGDKRVHWGTFSSTNATGGDITTGLSRVEIAWLQHKGSATEAAVAVINETFPLASGSPTVVCTSGDTGYWIAIGT